MATVFRLFLLVLALLLVPTLRGQTGPTEPGEPDDEGPVLTLETDVFATSTQSRMKADFTCARVVSLGQAALAGAQPPRAGESFSDWELGLSASYAEIQDEFAGHDGHHWDSGIYLATTWRDQWHLTIQAGTGRYSYAGGFLALEDTYVDLVALYQALPWLAIGPFFEIAHIDFDTRYEIEGHAETLAGGLIAAASWALGPGDLSLTSALASMNKETVADLFDDAETALAFQLDYGLPLGERWRLTPFAYYFTMLDNERPVDGHYWLGGVELTWEIREELELTVGYDTYFANDSYDEQRVMANLNYRF